MNKCICKKFISSTPFFAVSSLLISCKVFALPEDQHQQIVVVADSSEIHLNEGLQIYRGTEAVPAHITQGSMEIFGTEIRIERPAGVLQKVTATGTPARFQQQPAADEEIIHASGHTLEYDNSKRMLSIDVEARFSQAGTTIDGNHIDYNIDTGDANVDAIEGGKVKVVIPASQADKP